MIAGISHDLRTPLTRLGLAVEMLGEGADKELIGTIRRNLETMNTLIGQFLRFSKGVEGGMPVQLDLWEVIESAAADWKLEGPEIRLHRHNPPCRYLADPISLERVVTNLLKNAVQYGGSPIDVNLHCTDESVALEICDRGPGIPPGQEEAVFRPFHRLEASRSRQTGSGLGLAIARQIALKNDWKIELLPRKDGGTIARLSLPPARRHRWFRSSGRSSCVSSAPTSSWARPDPPADRPQAVGPGWRGP
jgi:two-component system osmolarity sensor histidine kinase EnvZ